MWSSLDQISFDTYLSHPLRKAARLLVPAFKMFRLGENHSPHKVYCKYNIADHSEIIHERLSKQITVLQFTFKNIETLYNAYYHNRVITIFDVGNCVACVLIRL